MFNKEVIVTVEEEKDSWNAGKDSWNAPKVRNRAGKTWMAGREKDTIFPLWTDVLPPQVQRHPPSPHEESHQAMQWERS